MCSVKDKSSNAIVNALRIFPDNGKKILNRPRSNKPPELKFVKLTILQMIATGVVEIILVEEKSDSDLNLGAHGNDFSPKYLHRQCWKGIVLVPPSQHN